MIPEPSRVSSKRALFTSPVEPCRPFISSLSQREITLRGRLPRRTLFSPPNDENKKRKRSTSPDGVDENRAEKNRRLKSPTRMHKSQSFSIAPSTSSSILDEHFRKRLIYRTQSETVAQKTESTDVKLGYMAKLTKDVLQKILCSVANALKSKGITNDTNDNYKQFVGLLARLVKKIFLEFYNPAIKSVSEQLSKFANFMVFHVVQSLTFEEIYQKTKEYLQSKNPAKLRTGYIAKQDYEFNMKNLVKSNNSLLVMSQSSSSLNFSRCGSFYENCSLNSSKLSESNSSLNLSSSKNNDMRPLRENFIGQSNEKSAKLSTSDSNLNKLKSSSSSNLMKAKRQISF